MVNRSFIEQFPPVDVCGAIGKQQVLRLPMNKIESGAEVVLTAPAQDGSFVYAPRDGAARGAAQDEARVWQAGGGTEVPPFQNCAFASDLLVLSSTIPTRTRELNCS